MPVVCNHLHGFHVTIYIINIIFKKNYTSLYLVEGLALYLVD